MTRKAVCNPWKKMYWEDSSKYEKKQGETSKRREIHLLTLVPENSVDWLCSVSQHQFTHSCKRVAVKSCLFQDRWNDADKSMMQAQILVCKKVRRRHQTLLHSPAARTDIWSESQLFPEAMKISSALATRSPREWSLFSSRDRQPQKFHQN